MGVDRRTGQYMLHDGSSIKLARTVLGMPGAEKWNKEAMSKIGCTRYDLHQPREPEVTFRERKEDVHEEPPRKVVMARQVYIKLADIESWTDKRLQEV